MLLVTYQFYKALSCLKSETPGCLFAPAVASLVIEAESGETEA